MNVRSGMPEDLAVARTWLKAARLPVADLTADHMESFLFASVEDQPVGMVGLEQYGSTALLRSLVVESGARSAGVGKQLVGALEQLARTRDVAELWLLTIDADRYFSALGYAVEDRDEAPDDIRNTVEFSKLCPGDAVLMRKRL